MTFVATFSKAFEQNVKADAKKFQETLSSLSSQSDTTSSTTIACSANQSSSNTINEVKHVVHLIPKSWVDKFHHYQSTCNDSDKPILIENESLLQQYNSDSKVFQLPKNGLLLSKIMTKSSSDAGICDGGSDSSIGVLVGSNPNSVTNSPTSSDNSVTRDDDESFLIDGTDVPESFTTNTNSSDVMDARTKRRIRWASKKKEKEKRKQIQASDDENDNDDDENDTNDNDVNIFKQTIEHEKDYYILGHGTWILLSCKFAFDVDIELPVYYCTSAGKLKVEKINVTIPDNGLFEYLQPLFSSNIESTNKNPINDSSDDDLYDQIDDRQEKEAPILLLPLSTSSYTSANKTPDASPTSYTSFPNKNDSSCITSNPRKRKRYGLGLGNLGNTCFMNSTLQCLAHTGPLRSYFLSGEYATDLNKENPLGTGGELASEFAKLLAEMWGTKDDNDDDDQRGDKSYRRTWSSFPGSSNAAVYPRNFKHTLGKHAEQFMGYNQHDSQELATYLLDALHEDTNRVSKKPYVKKPEQKESESDDAAAKRSWDLHLKREDSRVMENFMGQVKSRVECPIEGCGRISTTFDPFMYLSLPLPGATERTIAVEYYSIDPNIRLKRLKVTLSKNSNCKELRNKIVEKLNETHLSSENHVSSENVILAEKFNNEIYSFYSLQDEIEKIRETDKVVVFEVSSVKSIHDEVEMNEKSEMNSLDNDISDCDEQFDNRPNGRLQLSIGIKTKLNQGQEWEKILVKYLRRPHYLRSLLNPNRNNTEEREDFNRTICSFINRCYGSPECTNALRGRITPSSDLELESCDGDNSEDGKMSPTSTVATRLGATVVDDKGCPSLDELSDMSSTIQNVSSSEDVAILEFCSQKFRQHLKNEKIGKRKKFVDGAQVQVVFTRSSSIAGQFQAFGSPLVLRLSSVCTVFELRKILAKRLQRVLRNIDQNTLSNNDDLIKEEKIDEDQTSEYDMAHSSDNQCSDALGATNVMMQVPLTYDRGSISTGYSYSRYSSKSNSYRKLGSIPTPNDTSKTSQRSISAMPHDNDEKEFVLDHVANQGRINLCFATPLLEKMFDADEWSKAENILDSNDENDKPKVTSIVDCISKYCQVEQLEESEMWYCNHCKDHVRAWKQFHLYRTPPILIIHLKRFHYSALTHRRDKIDSFIDFPLEGLDLSSQVYFSESGQEPIYDCYAVSNHFGGLGGGHYTAYALNDDGEWCNFDDSRVTKNVEKSEVVSKSAYVLYYKRRDIRENDLRILPHPTSCSREPSPVSTDMDMETDNEMFSVDDNNNEEYGLKTYESLGGNIAEF